MAVPRFTKRLFQCKCSLKLMKMICFCAFWWWWWLESSPSDVHNNKCSPRQIYRWLNMNIKPLPSRWNTLLVLLRAIIMTTMIGYKSRRYISTEALKAFCGTSLVNIESSNLNCLPGITRSIPRQIPIVGQDLNPLLIYVGGGWQPAIL